MKKILNTLKAHIRLDLTPIGGGVIKPITQQQYD